MLQNGLAADNNTPSGMEITLPTEIWCYIGQFLEPQDLGRAHEAFYYYTPAFQDERVLYSSIIRHLSEELGSIGACVFRYPIIVGSNDPRTRPISEKEYLHRCLRAYFDKHTFVLSTLKQLYATFLRNKTRIQNSIVPAFFRRATNDMKQMAFFEMATLSLQCRELADFLFDLSGCFELNMNVKNVIGKTCLSQALIFYYKEKNQNNENVLAYVISQGASPDFLNDHDYNLYQRYLLACTNKNSPALKN